MKKITLLIFLLAFTTTTFAGRVLTIRNLSNETKYFFALEMQYDSVQTTIYHTYRSILDYIVLEPGDFITFSYIQSGINGFEFCPSSDSTHKVIHSEYPDPPIPIIPPDTYAFRWINYIYDPYNPDEDYNPYISENCDVVPPLPATLGNRLEFRGFKICEKDPVSGNIHAIDYFEPVFIDGYVHTPHNIKEKYFRMPSLPNPGIVESHEIIFQ